MILKHFYSKIDSTHSNALINITESRHLFFNAITRRIVALITHHIKQIVLFW